jgi:hypothetical protein
MAKVTDQTELAAAPAATDMFLVSEISSGLSKKINFNRMISGYRNFTTGTWIFAAPTSGVTVTVNGLAAGGLGFDVTAGAVGATFTGRVINTDNTNGASHARWHSVVGGASGGDAQSTWEINGVQAWSAGVDNSDSDAWVLSATASLGTSNVLRATAVGNVTVYAPSGGTALAVDGEVKAASGTATPAGGTAGKGLTFGTTTNLGVFFGSGAPTLSAAQGSIYLRTDGSSTSTRLYINTNGTTGWTNVTTAT